MTVTMLPPPHHPLGEEWLPAGEPWPAKVATDIFRHLKLELLMHYQLQMTKNI